MSGNMDEPILDMHVHLFGRKAELEMVNRFSTLFEGVIQANSIEENIASELVNEITENQVLPFLPYNSFLVEDDASVHNEVVLRRILARKNITLIKLPTFDIAMI